ncbi:unnamed protein product, partial [Owenia fusiformis]
MIIMFSKKCNKVMLLPILILIGLYLNILIWQDKYLTIKKHCLLQASFESTFIKEASVAKELGVTRDLTRESDVALKSDMTEKSSVTKKSDMTMKSGVTRKGNVMIESRVTKVNSMTKQPRITRKTNVTNRKLILSWSNLLHPSEYNSKLNQYEEHDVFALCPDAQCEHTTDRADFEQADAVLFPHGAWYHTLDVGITHSHINQVWIFYELEPPPLIPRRSLLKKYEGLFNWTMSYDFNTSDIWLPYGSYNDSHVQLYFNHYNMLLHHSYNFAENKTKLALFASSG